VSAAIVIGKLPSHGDFVARGVSAGERHELDEWLAGSMASAREEFGDRFDEAFDEAPPFRFAWSDECWTAGALAASIDSAGRRFPLLVARGDLAQEQVGPAARLCEEAASEAIAAGWSADELLQAVAAAEIAPGTSQVIDGWWNEDLGDAGPRLKDRRPAGILSHMLASVAGAAA
jgi:type VI secretion system protein ImpM